MNKEKKSKLNIFKEGGGWLSSLIMLILLWIIFAIGSEFFLTYHEHRILHVYHGNHGSRSYCSDAACRT